MKGYNPLNGTSPQQTLFIKRVLNKVKAALSGMQEKLTAGAGITISEENVISANVDNTYGVITDNGILKLNVASNTDISTGNQHKAIVPSNFFYAFQHGLVSHAASPLTGNNKDNAHKYLAIFEKILPDFPTEDGSYDLVVTVNGSNITLSWVAQGG